MKKLFGSAFAVLLCTAVWTYAAENVPIYTVTLSAEDGHIASQGDGIQGCEYNRESDSKIILECPENAEFEFWAYYSEDGYRVKCWKTSHDDCITFESNGLIKMKVKSDTALTAVFEEKPLTVGKALIAAENYQFPVYGQNTFYFVGEIDGGPRDAYVSFQYDNGKGFRNVTDPVKIPKEKLSKRIMYKDSVFTAYFSSTFEGVFNVNGTEKKISFKGQENTTFRLAASYESSAITNFADNVVYSGASQINWMHHVVFRSVSGIAIRDYKTSYGSEWYLPSDRDKIEVPDDDDKYVYDYRWHRIGASGEEYLSSDVEKIIVGDSVHYQAEVIKKEKIESSSSSVKAESSSSVKVTSSSSSSKVTSSSSYDINELPEIAFTVTGLEVGKKVEDIKVKTPNKCFSVTEKIFWQRVDGDMLEVTTLEPNRRSMLIMDVDVSSKGDCANDSLADIWRFFMNDTAGAEIYTVNGETYRPIATGETRVWYSFETGDEPESSSSSAKAKSSSSSAKSSSSKKSGKSSSSKGKDAIVAAGQVPQFSLMTVGRNIQVAGARVGSAYAVLDMQGRVMLTGRVDAANFSLALDRAGTYLVRIGSQAQTVKLR